MKSVIPAPPSTASSTQAARLGVIVCAVVVMAYTFAAFLALYTGAVSPQRAYLLMLLPCLVPAGWNLYGFLAADAGDGGLLVSGGGWLLACLALLLRQLEVNAALAQIPAGALSDVATSPIVYFCSLAAVVLIIAGAAISWRNFARRAAAGQF